MGNTYLELAGMAYVLAVSQCEMNWTLSQRGILGSIGFIGLMASCHLCGFLADTTGRKRIIIGGLLSGFMCTILSSFSNSFEVLLILRLCNGICISGALATIYAYFGEFFTSKNRDRAMLRVSIVYGGAALLVPILAALIINLNMNFHIPVINIQYKSWRLFMVACGLPGFICGLIFLSFPESPKYLLSTDKQEETLNALRMIYCINTGKDASTFPVLEILKDPDTTMAPKIVFHKTQSLRSIAKFMWIQTVPVFSKEYIRATVIASLLIFVVHSSGVGLYMWFPEILNKVMRQLNESPNIDATICGIYNSDGGNNTLHTTLECKDTLEWSTYKYSILLKVISLAAYTMYAVLISYIPKGVFLCIIFTICGLAGIGAAFVKIPLLAIYFYLALLSCGTALKFVTAIVSEQYPTKLRAMAFSIIICIIGNIGAIFGSNFIGLLLKNHCDMVFYLSGATAIIVGFTVFLLPKPKFNSSTNKE
ncbi:hypothetical protein ACFFRR_001536 [Megaselia abdita]